MRSALLHHYRAFRAHQMKTFGSLTLYPSGRTEITGGGAAYGYHAAAALHAARGHLHFRASLAEAVANAKKRSRAAKRGWRTRRSAAAA